MLCIRITQFHRVVALISFVIGAGCMNDQLLGGDTGPGRDAGVADASAKENLVDSRPLDTGRAASHCRGPVACSVEGVTGTFDCTEAAGCAITCVGNCEVQCGTAPCRVTCPPNATCNLLCGSGVAPVTCGTAPVRICNGARCS